MVTVHSPEGCSCMGCLSDQGSTSTSESSFPQQWGTTSRSPTRRPAVWILGALLILHLKRKSAEAPPARTTVFFLFADLKSPSDRAQCDTAACLGFPQMICPMSYKLMGQYPDEEGIGLPPPSAAEMDNTARCSQLPGKSLP